LWLSQHINNITPDINFVERSVVVVVVVVVVMARSVIL
jgi:hypothetical protein